MAADCHRRGRCLNHNCWRRVGVFLSLLAISGCSHAPQPSAGGTAAIPDPAGRPPIKVLGPPSALPGFHAGPLLVADFRAACPRLRSRDDPSGLTRPDDWAPACADAESAPQTFLDRHFVAVRIADGEGLLTGYYQPLVPVEDGRQQGLVPVLGVPAGGLCDRGPCPTRAEIEAGALEGRAPILAWADPIDLFFLQVQGSGVLQFPDGRVRPVGFAGHNGHPYVAIGRLMRDRRLIEGPVGMAEIRGWLKANPEAGRALMRENPRYIFFAPRGGADPVGSLGVPLRPMRAIAVDPRLVPLGAPAWLEGRIAGVPWAGPVLAADTGAAIVGPNRVDLFIGTGESAAAVAGPLQDRARLILLLPRAAAARLSP